ncbi:MAG: LptF/LptG family permease [Longimicrobiales bacterium]
MRVLDRLVARTFLRLFLIFLLASPALFVLGHLTENIDTYVDRSLTLGEIARSYLFRLPLYIQWSFPIAALLAAVFTVHGMTAHREIVAAKAGGVSFHRVVAPVLVLGLLLTGVALGLSEVVPRGNRVAAEIVRDEEPGRSWRSDFVYESEDGTTWKIGRLTAADGRMSQVTLERPAEGPASGVHVLADAAEWDSIAGWTFARGYVRQMRADSTNRAFQFERLRLAGLEERPEELLERPRDAEEMTYSEITRQARIIERTGGNARELQVKKEQKLSIPVATLVVILLGMPLATSNKRGGTAYGVGISLGITMLYFLLLRVAGALGEAGALSPPTAAWIPNILFFAAALVLIGRVRT